MPQVSYIDWAYQQSKKETSSLPDRQYWSEKLSAAPKGWSFPPIIRARRSLILKAGR